MTNTNTQTFSPDHQVHSPSTNEVKKLSKKTKVAASITALLIGAGVGTSAYRGANESPFATNIAVPTEAQPHVDYTVQAGDTEQGIANKFDKGYDQTDYENMINAQLPDNDQSTRTLPVGYQLRLPK